MLRHVLLYNYAPGRPAPAEEGASWTAHDLDADVTATGATPAEAFASLLEAVEIELHVRRELGADAAPLRPAPPSLWAAFRDALPLPSAARPFPAAAACDLALALAPAPLPA